MASSGASLGVKTGAVALRTGELKGVGAASSKSSPREAAGSVGSVRPVLSRGEGMASGEDADEEAAVEGMSVLAARWAWRTMLSLGMLGR